MQGKVVIVTGANSGIGYVTARELARMGATVVMVCRSKERGATALAKIKRELAADNASADLLLMLCDLSSDESITTFAETYYEKIGRLDVLINNAGAMFTRRKVNAAGIELTFALNHLGYYLLTLYLLELLNESEQGRIINVASGAHNVGTFDFDDYNREKKYQAFQAYGQSKMANILFSNELSRRLEETTVTVNSLHPGFVRTNFATNNGWYMKLLTVPIGLISGISAEKGAQTSIYLASSPDVAQLSGKYFYRSKPQGTHPFADDPQNALRLWELSANLTGVSIE